MIQLTCQSCHQIFSTYPSRSKAKYCSTTCYDQTRNEALTKIGEKYRYKPGHQPSPNRQLPAGPKHYAWKGTEVGYRGLHYWLRRVKGIPKVCIKCGKGKGRFQWANVDGKYTRDPSDYVSMCASCHKYHDLNLRSNRDVPSAT